MLDQEDIEQQQSLLNQHRRRLGVLLQQQARLGDYAPAHILLEIEDTQAAIHDLKETLSTAGIVVEDEPNDEARPTAVATPSHLTPQERRNRSRMLQKVRDFWIKGVLENSLYGAALIELGLEYKPDAVQYPWDMIIQQPDQPARTIAPGAKIIDIFNELGGELLILGAPGSGKTTMLLELARDLITRAAQDDNHPIPVVFNLSSWSAAHASLAEWLIDELNIRYDVPRKIGTTWLDTDQVLPLLDGLDEVIHDQRELCLTAINTFRQVHGLVSLVVCSRVRDYHALSMRLKLHGAVLIQPLAAQQIDDYLITIGEAIPQLRALLQHDAVLREFAEAPLVLSTMVLAYQGTSVDALATGGTIEEQRRQLFDTYIRRMLVRRGLAQGYSNEHTRAWLRWLAQRMVEHAQTVFLLEQLQPDWLPNPTLRIRYTLLDRLGSALTVGLLTALLTWLIGYPQAAVLQFSLTNALIVGLFGGAGILLRDQQSHSRFVLHATLGWLFGFGVVGLLVGAVEQPLQGVVAGFIAGVPLGVTAAIFGLPRLAPRRIIIVETLRWSWSGARRFGLIAFLFGGIFGAFGGLLGMLLGIIHGVIGLLYCGIAAVISALGAAIAGMMLGGVVGDRLDTQAHPNQGIRRSARSALFAWLALGLVAAPMSSLLSVVIRQGILAYDTSIPPEIFFWVGGVPASALVGTILIGIIGMLAFGGYAVLSHVSLRLVLWHSGVAPLDYVRFLDYCTERIFLRKVGGGYIFVHRMLMEHFASLDTESLDTKSPDTQSLDIQARDTKRQH
jgi:eukaryotic-like serine/threonine-protein kinase